MDDEYALFQIHRVYELVQENLSLCHETHLVHEEAKLLYEASLKLYDSVVELSTRQSVEVRLRVRGMGQ